MWGIKVSDFQQIAWYILKWHEIDTLHLWKVNRKVYALYQMVTMPVTMSDPYFYVLGLPSSFVSDIAVFVLKRDVKLQLTN